MSISYRVLAGRASKNMRVLMHREARTFLDLAMSTIGQEVSVHHLFSKQRKAFMSEGAPIRIVVHGKPPKLNGAIWDSEYLLLNFYREGEEEKIKNSCMMYTGSLQIRVGNLFGGDNYSAYSLVVKKGEPIGLYLKTESLSDPSKCLEERLLLRNEAHQGAMV